MKRSAGNIIGYTIILTVTQRSATMQDSSQTCQVLDIFGGEMRKQIRSLVLVVTGGFV